MIGYPLQRAEQTLTQNGLSIGLVSQQRSPAPAGTVVGTFPSPYTTVLPGTRIDLVVALPGS
ncbi:MAG: PASTA domain-containing protein [Pseudonocardia sp.]|nr:PASTA domain-containing protein [Pseudonocardia sp.]